MFTDTAHPRGVAAKDFLWNKCSVTIQRQILQDDIKNAAQLWTYLKKEVTVAARQSILSLQRELFNATLLHDESISEISVRLQELKQQIALGGVTISEDQLIMHPSLPFSKLNKIFFGYFDPENVFLDNENKLFSG